MSDYVGSRNFLKGLSCRSWFSIKYCDANYEYIRTVWTFAKMVGTNIHDQRRSKETLEGASAATKCQATYVSKPPLQGLASIPGMLFVSTEKGVEWTVLHLPTRIGIYGARKYIAVWCWYCYFVMNLPIVGIPANTNGRLWFKVLLCTCSLPVPRSRVKWVLSLLD